MPRAGGAPCGRAALGCGTGDRVEMTHLAAGFDLGFAIKMKGGRGCRNVWNATHIVADEIFHDDV